MAREDPQMKIRFPVDLKDRIEQSANDSGRSMNAEIVARLAASFHPHADTEALQREIEHLQARLQAAGKVTNLVETTQAILASSLRSAIDRMPEQLQKEHATIRLLANSIVHGDARGMGAAFARILEADADPVKGAHEASDLRQFMGSMEPAIAAKERGEDLEPYQKADFDKMRDRLDAAITKPPKAVGQKNPKAR